MAGRRLLAHPLVMGLASGLAALSVGCIGLLTLIGRASGKGVPPVGSVAIALLGVLWPICLCYATLGTAIGAAAYWITAGPARATSACIGRIRLNTAHVIASLWFGVAIAAATYSPRSLAVSVLARVPIGLLMAGLVLCAITLAIRGRVGWLRYAVVSLLFAIPSLIPSSDGAHASLDLPRATSKSAGSVLILGLDDVDRDGMRSLYDLLRHSNGSNAGLRFLGDAVSPVPVTRFAWQSILLASPASLYMGTDTLTPVAWRQFLNSAPFLLTRRAKERGYRSYYLSDDATTFTPTAPELFDEVVVDAAGWKVSLRARIADVFPVYERFIARWTGVGIAGTIGADGSWRLLKRAAQTLSSASRPELIAAHAVALHGPIRPTMADAGNAFDFLRLTPRDYRVPFVAAGGVEARLAPPPRELTQSVLYESRSRDLVETAANFIVSLDRSGYRENNLIIVLSDHGELFLKKDTLDLPGLHGLRLDGHSIRVGVLVLLPKSLSPDSARVVHGTFAIHQIGALVAEFLSRSDLPAKESGRGLLTAVVRGNPLGRQAIPARSWGRISFPSDYEGVGAESISGRVVENGVHFWPDGRISMRPAVWKAITATADTGWTDGDSLVSFSPLPGGAQLRQQYVADERVSCNIVVTGPPVLERDCSGLAPNAGLVGDLGTASQSSALVAAAPTGSRAKSQKTLPRARGAYYAIPH